MNEAVSCYKKYTFKSKTIYSLDVAAAAGIIASIVFIMGSSLCQNRII